MVSNQTEHVTEDFQACAEQLPGQDLAWLRSFRSEALDRFKACGFPSVREEEWRYTNVAAIEKKRFSPALAFKTSALDTVNLQDYYLSDAWNIVLADGCFHAELSRLQDLPGNVIVTSMRDALQRFPEQVQAYLGQAVSAGEHGFVAFNNAWFSDGLFIHIPEQVALTKPLQIIHFTSEPDKSLVYRHVYVIDAMAQAHVIENYAGDDLSYLSASVAEVFIGENADLTVTKVQSESSKAFHFGGCYVKQAAYSRFRHDNFALGGLLARNDIRADLAQSAECELNGLYLGAQRQHIDNHTRINHLQPYGISREQYKGVLDQRARGVFQGRVVVAENAQKTDSQMNNRNLLLSSDAEADSKPQLEIYADDVKCSHGMTIGQLDDKSMFYLQSRGMAEVEARNMLTFAFANEMVGKIKLTGLHEQVLRLLLQQFPQQDMEAEWL